MMKKVVMTALTGVHGAGASWGRTVGPALALEDATELRAVWST